MPNQDRQEAALRVSLATTLMGVLALQAGSHGQAPAPAQPTFRSGTTLVEVSAVITRDGRPVADVRADEVTVFDNGVKQSLTFEYVDLGIVDAPALRRDLMIVIDNLHIDPTRTPQTVGTALAFIDRLGTCDRLAVVTTGLPDPSLDFTTDREAARAFVRGTRGQQQLQSLVAGELDLRARMAMERLAKVATGVRSDGERRSVLLISEGHRTLNQESQLRRTAHNLSQMIQDSRRYYRMAYVQPDPRPGRKQPETREIKVKVSRDDVGVRARRRYAPVTDVS